MKNDRKQFSRRDFLAALAHGMPDCAGLELGFVRLAMLA